MSMPWPTTEDELLREQERLASCTVAPWDVPRDQRPLRLGGCAVVFGRAGRDGVAWAAAVLEEATEVLASSSLATRVGVPFRPGLLALREGPVLEAVVRGLPSRPDVLLVAAAGRDHPRRAGLAVQLGAVLDVPTVGVTEEPLVATGEQPERSWGSREPLRIGEEVVGYRVRTRAGAKPVIAHAGWRTSPEVAAEVVLGGCSLARWPEAIRAARRTARELRARIAAAAARP